MANDKKYKVIIRDAKRIPTIGAGPILNPIVITEDQYKLLKTLGFNVVEVSQGITLNKIEDPMVEQRKEEIMKASLEETPVEDTVEEELEESEEEVVEEEATEKVEDVLEDETEEEVESVEEVESEDDATEDVMIDDVSINELSKRELKEKLTELGISYKNNASLNALRTLLIENYKKVN